ncbi:MAG: patatin-like phospholipase family protein [Nitrospirota bacterium]
MNFNVNKEISVGIALSGGAARCIAHIGVLEVIEKEGIKIGAAAGTSAGSFIGALFTSGEVDIKDMKKMAKDVKWRDILMPTLPKLGLISSEKIYRYVNKVIGYKDFTDMRIPLGVVAANINDGRKMVITSGSVARAVQASCSLPVIFTPTEIDGKLLIDGGIVSQLPVLAARDVLKKKFIIAVDVNFNAREYKKINNIFKVGIHLVSLIARQNATMEKKFADVSINVDVKGISLFDLDKWDILIERGKKAAERKIDIIKERLRTFPY